MTLLSDFSWLQNRFAETLGWTLAYSLWELALIAAFVAIGLWFCRRTAPHARYLIACAGMILFAAAPIGTYFYLLPPAPRAPVEVLARQETVIIPQALPATAVERPGTLQADMPPAAVVHVPLSLRIAAAIRPLLPYVLMIYFSGVLVLALRMALGYWRLRSLFSAAAPVAANVQAQLSMLLTKLSMSRAVRVLESACVEVPTLIGAFRPVILLPLSALTGISADQLSALLAHELAHIRRHDYLVNLVQSVVETLLFYHPAVWWISARIRQERENCCDDLAIGVTGDRIAYVNALAAMEFLRSAPPHVPAGLALAAGGGALLPRIRRILGVTPAPQRFAGASTVAFAVLLICGLLYVGCRNDTNAVGPQQAVTSAPATAPAESASPPGLIPFDRKTVEDEYRDVMRARGTWPELPENQAAQVKLDATLKELNVDHQGLEKVINYLRDNLGANIFVNWNALRKVGIDPNTEVTASLRNVPFRKALTTVLAEVGGSKAILAFTIDQGIVTISTKDDLTIKNLVEMVRVFDIRDMIGVVAGQEKQREVITKNIIDVIQSTVAPDTWRDNGGKIGSIRELNGQLIVNQSADNLLAIYNLLQQLRETRSIQIGIETRLIVVPQEVVKDIRIGWSSSLPAGLRGAVPGSTGVPGAVAGSVQSPTVNFSAAIIDNLILSQLLTATQADKRTIAVTNPRQTLFNGGSGTVAFSDPPGGTTKIPEGVKNIRVETSATVSADRRYVVMTVSPSVSTLDGTDKAGTGTTGSGTSGNTTTAPGGSFVQLPQTALKQVNTAVSVPDSGTLLSRPTAAPVKTMAAIPDGGTLLITNGTYTDPATGIVSDVLLLVRPSLFIHRDIENDLFGPGYDRQSGATSQPGLSAPAGVAPTTAPTINISAPAAPDGGSGNAPATKQIAVESRMLEVSNNFLDDFRVGWNMNATSNAPPNAAKNASVIDNWSLSMILTASQADRRTITHAAPRFVLASGKSAKISMDDRNLVPGMTLNATATQPGAVPFRFELAIAVKVAANGRDVLLTIDPDAAALPGDAAKPIGELFIPDGGTLLIDKGTVRNATTGVERHLLLLIHPKVLTDGNGNTDAFDPKSIQSPPNARFPATTAPATGSPATAPAAMMDDQSALRRRQVAALVSDAGKLFDAEQLKEAADLLRQAVVIDPQDKNAQLLLRLVQDKITARDNSRPTTAPAGGATSRPAAESVEHLIPYADLMVFPDNWPEITRKRGGDASQESEATRKARARLEDELKEITADRQGLEKVINFLRDNMGANIFVNWNALQAVSIDRKTEVTVSLKEVPFRKALTAVLASVDGGKGVLGYTIDDGIITISTKDDLNSTKYQVVRVFDIRDLVGGGGAATRPAGGVFSTPGMPPAAEQVEAARKAALEAARQEAGDPQRAAAVKGIIDAIEAHVEPESWRDKGGMIGSIRELNGQLIVNQSADNQIAIYDYLQQLRETRKGHAGTAPPPATTAPVK